MLHFSAISAIFLLNIISNNLTVNVQIRILAKIFSKLIGAGLCDFFPEILYITPIHRRLICFFFFPVACRPSLSYCQIRQHGCSLSSSRRVISPVIFYACFLLVLINHFLVETYYHETYYVRLSAIARDASSRGATAMSKRNARARTVLIQARALIMQGCYRAPTPLRRSWHRDSDAHYLYLQLWSHRARIVFVSRCISMSIIFSQSVGQDLVTASCIISPRIM